MSVPKIIHWIGLSACILLIGCCFMPWAFYPDLNETFTGFFSEQNVYGKPGVLLVPIALGSLLFMLLPKIWAKRTNMFWSAIGLGYAIKSYIVYTGCYGGFCPEKKTGIYLMLLSAILILVAAIFPDVDMNENK